MPFYWERRTFGTLSPPAYAASLTDMDEGHPDGESERPSIVRRPLREPMRYHSSWMISFLNSLTSGMS